MPVFEGAQLIGARAPNIDNPRRRYILQDCGEICGCLCTMIIIFLILDAWFAIVLTRGDVKYIREHMLYINSTSQRLYITHLNNTN
jgi:hypothetical protein